MENQTNVKKNGPEHNTSYIKLRNIADKDMEYTDTLHRKSVENTMCGNHCVGALMHTLTNHRHSGKSRPPKEVLQHAEDFIDQYYKSLKGDHIHVHQIRLKEIIASMESTGTYDLTYDELAFGTKLAWRNTARCIGRIQWSNLHLFDARKETTARGMFNAICRHLEYTTNKGKIRTTITVFKERTDEGHDFRIWNSQFIMYAGYKQHDGSIVGDPINVELTSASIMNNCGIVQSVKHLLTLKNQEIMKDGGKKLGDNKKFCVEMGWKGHNGMFDVLPLVLQANGGEPELFDIPKELIMEVNITHPKFQSLAKLGLKWYCVPAMSNMMFDCGGNEFTACAFTAWYMSTEVAVRDLCDKHRYNMLEKIASHIGLDTRTNASLWKDRAAVEINIAVLHSFQASGVTIVDHHTASESFMTFLHNEYKQRGGCPADWVWLVPPISGSLSPVFHQEMVLFKLKPSYEYQDDVLKNYAYRKGQVKKGRSTFHFRTAVRAVMICSFLMQKVLIQRTKCTILFATETGKSEKFANTLNEVFKHNFNSRIMDMQNYKLEELQYECVMLFVASTFGDGDPPENGKSFVENITEIKDFGSQQSCFKNETRRDEITERISRATHGYKRNDVLKHVKFAVFGLGSRAYPNFCAFGHHIDRTMTRLGAIQLHEIGEGDELCGQDESFRTWAKQVFQVACRSFNIKNTNGYQSPSDVFEKDEMAWCPEKFRLVPASSDECLPLNTGLAKIYNKATHTCFLKDKIQLEMKESSRQTILVKIDLGERARDITYSPGDHVLIFAKNPRHLVCEIIQKVKEPPQIGALMKIERIDDSSTPDDQNEKAVVFTSFDRFPPSTFEDFLTNYLDITTPPSQDFLKKLFTLARTEVDRKEIERLAKNVEAYDDWKRNGMPTLADLFKCFPSLHVCPTFLLTQLPVLQPRYYSISSSLDATPGELHITAEVLEYRTPDESKHMGVCTNWLNTLTRGNEIHCSLKNAPLFHMPTDSTLPILMVGPGTGIAPFRSFWMQRTIDKANQDSPQCGNKRGWGDLFLYFGCRYSNLDNIYKEELEECEKKGVITKCFFAFSREPGMQKTYVQDLLIANGKEVYKNIFHENGHIYICGNIQMASDVKETLCTIIQTWGKMSSHAAHTFVARLKEENSLHEDIFGVALKSAGKKN